MPFYRGMVTRYGYATVEANNDEEALEQLKNLSENDFDWEKDGDGFIEYSAVITETDIGEDG